MSTQTKYSTAPIDPYGNGALFHLNEIMSWNQFNFITQVPRFTYEPFPSYKDGFYQLRQLLKAFNDHMISIFQQGGFHFWMSQCNYGQEDGVFQDGCGSLASLIPKGMNIILYVIAFQVSCMDLRVRIPLKKKKRIC